MLASLGRIMYRRRWLVVVVWLTVLASSAVFAPRVIGVLHGGGYTVGNSQSVAAYNTLNRAYGYRALIFNVVFDGRPERLLPAATAFRAAAYRRFGNELQIARPVPSPDRRIVFERIYAAPQQDLGAGFAAPLRALLPRGAVRGYLAGPAAIFHDMEVVSDQDLRTIELITLPIALVVLVLIFGSVVSSLVPVLMAPVSVTTALALIYAIGHQMDMSIFVLNTTSMVGLGVAIDYSLFMVHRFREELGAGLSVEEAVARTVGTSGRAILVSALVVTIGFSGLMLSGVAMLSSLGIGGALVTVISLSLALTLLPALLGIMGPRINLWPVVPHRLSTVNFWRRLASAVMRFPVAVILLVGGVIAVFSLPALHLRVGIPGPEILPASIDSHAGNDLLLRHLGTAAGSPVLIVAQRLPGTPVKTYSSAAFSILDRICSSSRVAAVSNTPIADSPAQLHSCDSALKALTSATPRQQYTLAILAQHHSVALVSAYLRGSPSTAGAEDYVGALRRSLSVPGYRVLVGGQTAGQMDFDSHLYSRFPLIATLVIVAIFLVLLVGFRSALLPLKAVLMNAFSVGAAYGANVWAFQDAHLSHLLNFTPAGNIDSLVPVFLFCVLFGLSTDYEVFLLTRVREEYLASGDNEDSVVRGLEATGRIITSAAAVMCLVFFAFAFSRLVIVKEVGFGLAVAVLVDATLIRILLVPAVMRLLGRWNWWLPFLGHPKDGGSLERPEARRAG